MSGSTSLYKLTKPTVSGDSDIWGGLLNTDMDGIDKLIGAITTTGSANAYLLTSGQSLTAYATGQRFRCKLNFTCSGSSTLNVDSIGAKTIKKRNATTNVSSGDLVSGTVYTFTYDGTNMVLETYVASDVQPLDATLTALAALSWASGNPLVQFTAADTVSLTLTPSVTSITTSNSAAATTPAATHSNTTDNAAVQVSKWAGARATPANNDTAYNSGFLNSSTGTAREVFRMTWRAASVTNGAENGEFLIGLMASGSLANRFIGTATAWSANTNDGASLGTTSLGWADLFLASGGVINWNNGTFTLTQTSTNLAASGSITANMALSTETGGTLTSASANRYIDLASGPTMPNAVFSAGQWQYMLAGASARTVTRGASVTMYVNGVDSATATLAARGTCFAFWDTASVCYLSGDVS